MAGCGEGSFFIGLDFRLVARLNKKDLMCLTFVEIVVLTF